MHPTNPILQSQTNLLLNDSSVETLGLLNIDGLDVRVQSLLGALLVVTLARDTDTHAEGNALDTGFPDLLVQLGVETDVLGALLDGGISTESTGAEGLRIGWEEEGGTYHSVHGEGTDLLDSTRSTLLESNTVQLKRKKRIN